MWLGPTLSLLVLVGASPSKLERSVTQGKTPADRLRALRALAPNKSRDALSAVCLGLDDRDATVASAAEAQLAARATKEANACLHARHRPVTPLAVGRLGTLQPEGLLAKPEARSRAAAVLTEQLRDHGVLVLSADDALPALLAGRKLPEFVLQVVATATGADAARVDVLVLTRERALRASHNFKATGAAPEELLEPLLVRAAGDTAAGLLP